MNRQEVFDWAKKKYGAEPDYPWADENAVLRHSQNKKWYAAVLKVGRDKLGLKGGGTVFVLNVKCEPVLIASLCAQPGFFPAYHMNKEHWVSILLDGSVPGDVITNLLGLSYGMTGSKERTG